MRTISSLCLAGAFAMTLFTGAAVAQYTSTPAPASPPAAKMAPAAPTAAAKPARRAASLDCSRQADAKGLHGKERRKFRSACLKGPSKAM